MITPVLADMLMKGATSLPQVAATGKVATDKAFQKIFDSSMQNSNKAIQNANETNEGRRSESEPAKETSRDTAKATTEETDATRERTDVAKTASAKADRKNKESDDSARDAKKADEKTVAEKIEKLKKSDPESYNAMIANLDNMTLGNLLSTMGFNPSDMSGLAPGVDLAGSVPEDLKLALKAGDSMGIGSALTALGIGDAGNGASVPTLASQADMAIAGATADTAEKAFAKMKSDSRTAPAADSNDSMATTAEQAPTKGASPDNSKPQTGSSGADNGNAGLGSNNGSPAASSVNVSALESKPEVNAVDPFNLADPALQAANAPAQVDGASQQVESKPAITTQNQTNETDRASAVNTQAGKSDQAQAPSETRPANAPKQAFERMVLDQVAEKAKFVVRPNGASNMVIKLDPPTLGRIDMRVEVREGVVRAAIVAENNDVKNAIEGNIEHLKKSLHASGLKVDEISVTVGGENGFQFKNDSMAQNAGFQNHGDGRRAHQGHAANTPVMAADDSVSSMAKGYAHSGLLNVVA